MKLRTPKGEVTRPTSAKARESLINMLQQEIPGALVADFFSGSGAIGLSAVSRGARGCIFIEKDRSVFSVLDQNLKEASRRASNQNVDLQPFKALNKDASAAWSDIQRYGAVDIVWADPPYADTVKWVAQSQSQIRKLLSEDVGIFALECSFDDRAEIIESLKDWELAKERKFGGTLITLWK